MRALSVAWNVIGDFKYSYVAMIYRVGDSDLLKLKAG